MHNFTNMQDHVLHMIIIDCDLGSKVISESKKVGATGGTIILASGTIRNQVLIALGIDESKKEIVLIITPNHLQDVIHQHLSKKFHMEKPNHGIILSMDINNVLGLRSSSSKSIDGGDSEMKYEVLFTIIDRGLAHEVVDAALEAGSNGATIINARGSGIHEKEKFFSMKIEPEKEIVMIITEKEKVEDIIKSIEDKMQITEPGKGIIFTIDINKVTGLYTGE